MEFIGEHLLPGQLGTLFIKLALITSVVACLSYFQAAKASNPHTVLRCIRLGRLFFYIQTIAMAVVFGLLVFIIQHHLFEYKYAWQHSSLTLESRFLLACLWEGQEGSFLLWLFWHCVLGFILIRSAKDWEPPVMMVISFAQVCLWTMIVGVYLFDIKIGSSPFVLLRNEIEGPVFRLPNYLTYIKDGNGLNPLLQNYWMVIHPPVLFLGFASCIVPFAFAFSALWVKRYQDWIKPALPWALFAAALLGTGIMMGAIWAYESLTFGGYWTWDPVENASLVPWLLLIAGIHTMLIYKHSGRSLPISFVFILLSFLLIIYATYLTRSGILGDSSVHAFTNLGMKLQLLLFLASFVIPVASLYLLRKREIPLVKTEEAFSSREWWMFVGSLVLLISAISICTMTSIPVYNELAELVTDSKGIRLKPLGIGENAKHQYNQVQIYVAILIGLLTAVVQYLNYQKTSFKRFIKGMGLPSVIALILSLLIIYFGDINYTSGGFYFEIKIWIAIWATLYAAIANLYYFITRLKLNIQLAGSVLSHTGFAILLIGVLISSSGQKVLSAYENPINGMIANAGNDQSGENFTLLKDVRTAMGEFWVTYLWDSSSSNKPLSHFTISFVRKDKSDSFLLRPTAFINYKGNNGLISNPSAKHYWNHDIFMYVSSVPDPAIHKDSILTEMKSMQVGDSILLADKKVKLTKLISKSNFSTGKIGRRDTAHIATLSVVNKSGETKILNPILLKRDNADIDLPDSSIAENYMVHLRQARRGMASIELDQKIIPIKYITVKVMVFPFIYLVWLGTVIMVIGFMIGLRRYLQRI